MKQETTLRGGFHGGQKAQTYQVDLGNDEHGPVGVAQKRNDFLVAHVLHRLVVDKEDGIV